jgi:2',3'-cyclic-nucleotide 2'-phosphodiesterase (5'-nucleotidase family)
MNALVYDAATAGNHGFDFGQKKTSDEERTPHY